MICPSCPAHSGGGGFVAAHLCCVGEQDSTSVPVGIQPSTPQSPSPWQVPLPRAPVTMATDNCTLVPESENRPWVEPSFKALSP